MDSWQARISRLSTQALVEELTSLEMGLPLVRSRAKVIGTPAEAIVLGELDAELTRLRKEYINITTSTHPNIVATSLAHLQGRETQVQDLIEMWKDAKDADSTLDTRIKFCKKQIKERQQQAESRRIGNE